MERVQIFLILVANGLVRSFAELTTPTMRPRFGVGGNRHGGVCTVEAIVGDFTGSTCFLGRRKLLSDDQFECRRETTVVASTAAFGKPKELVYVISSEESSYRVRLTISSGQPRPESIQRSRFHWDLSLLKTAGFLRGRRSRATACQPIAVLAWVGYECRLACPVGRSVGGLAGFNSSGKQKATGIWR